MKKIKPKQSSFIKVKKLLSDPHLPKYLEAGLINEVQLRNMRIKVEYETLRQTMSYFDALCELAEKYSLSEDSIHSIIYRNRSRKRFTRI